jgi:hypothetical protein
VGNRFGIENIGSQPLDTSCDMLSLGNQFGKPSPGSTAAFSFEEKDGIAFRMTTPNPQRTPVAFREIDERASESQQKESLLSQEAIEACAGLGRVLKKIHARLVNERYHTSD